MLFLISSAPDTKEFKTAFKLAKDMDAEICLLQNAVYASGNLNDSAFYALKDDMRMRGISENGVSGKPVDYSRLIDLMTEADKVVGFF